MKTFSSLCLWHHLRSWKPTGSDWKSLDVVAENTRIGLGAMATLVLHLSAECSYIQRFQRGVKLQHTEWWRWRIRGRAASFSWYILFISLMVISFSAVERRINVSEAKFAWDSRKSSKISSEVVIKCEGWACTIVKDFEPAEKTNRSRSRGKGGNKGMYSSSEASVSRADSPVIFVVGLCFSLIGWLWASCVLSY